jgi:ABC-type transport system involved in Fe-S cluster assembly fused permease/ATPase subunit
LGEGRLGEESRKGEMGKLRGSGKWVRRSGKVEREMRKGERSTLLRKLVWVGASSRIEFILTSEYEYAQFGRVYRSQRPGRPRRSKLTVR